MGRHATPRTSYLKGKWLGDLINEEREEEGRRSTEKKGKKQHATMFEMPERKWGKKIYRQSWKCKEKWGRPSREHTALSAGEGRV